MFRIFNYSPNLTTPFYIWQGLKGQSYDIRACTHARKHTHTHTYTHTHICTHTKTIGKRKECSLPPSLPPSLTILVLTAAKYVNCLHPGTVPEPRYRNQTAGGRRERKMLREGREGEEGFSGVFPREGLSFKAQEGHIRLNITPCYVIQLRKYFTIIT